MNVGRLMGAGVAVFVVRFLLNFLFYGTLMSARYQEISDAHPGMMREVIPAYAVLDLVTAFLIVWLFAKAGSAFGGGVKGGATVGVLVAVLGPVIGGLYYFFSVTYYPSDLAAIEAVYALVAHAVQGAVAGAVYKAA